jgi:hypothetical protein
VLLGASGALVGSIAASGGCYPQGQCAAETPPPTISVGEMADPDTYETSPFEDPARWIDYPANTTITVAFPEGVRLATLGRGISAIRGWVRSTSTGDPNTQIVETSGQLAGYQDAGAGGFMVSNETCQEYRARFEVSFYPSDAGTTVTDAGDGASE